MHHGRGALPDSCVADLSDVVEETPVEYPQLDVVEEDAELEEEPEEQINGETQEDDSRDPNTQNSPGRASNISGTTALTSHSHYEIDQRDAQTLLSSLSDLWIASNRIFSFYLPEGALQGHIEGTIRELHKPGSRMSQKLERLENALEKQWSEFADGYGQFAPIDVSIILRAFFKVKKIEQIGSGIWRPDNIIFKANIVKLLTSFVGLQQASQAINKLDMDFPAPFLHDVVSAKHLQRLPDSIGYTNLMEATFIFALDTRTQAFIRCLRDTDNKPEFDPDNLLTQVFYTEPGLFKGWDVPSLSDDRLTTKQKKAILRRIETIRRFFEAENTQSTSVDLQGLEQEFSWQEFVMSILHWSSLRIQEIDEQVDVQGGDENVIDLLAEEVSRRETDSSQADMFVPTARSFANNKFERSAQTNTEEESSQQSLHSASDESVDIARPEVTNAAVASDKPTRTST